MRQIMNVKNLDDEKLNNLKSNSSISSFFIFFFLSEVNLNGLFI